jgi:hydrogenase small subunit
MRKVTTLGEYLQAQGISRRGFLKFCSATASLMALPPTAVAEIAKAMSAARRPSVIWLSFQECTGCTESLTRSHAPTLESLIFDAISLDYHHTLQVAVGESAEAARIAAMEESPGEYLLVVDGAIPLGNPGFSTIAGISNIDMLKESAANAAAIIAVGTCAAFGGIPQAKPNPTGAVAVSEIIKDKPIINISGCPPIPAVITGVLAHYLTFDSIPDLDELGRPVAFYGQNIHDRCYRRPFYERGEFAHTFDDEGARKGWCLYELGCKGPIAYNACATVGWNEGASFPIASGHGCLGCSESGFWDKGSFYTPVSAGLWGSREALVGAAAAGAAIGIGSALAARARKKKALAAEEVRTS